MSIRIQTEALTGGNVSEASRADEIARSAPGGTKPASGRDAQDADRVELSGLSDHITNALRATEAGHSEKVRQLTALYASGRYTVDSERVSRAMVSEALGAAAPKSTGQ